MNSLRLRSSCPCSFITDVHTKLVILSGDSRDSSSLAERGRESQSKDPS
jgi:hypothetical protein